MLSLSKSYQIMPKQFLRQVAEHYYNRGEVERCCFIFPNRRSMAFFMKYLSESVTGADRPIIAPQMFTVNDFFYKVSGKRAIDRVAQLLELYQAYVNVFTAHNQQNDLKPETLDEFIFWGEVILSDFNDVDKYLVNPKQLFANVSDFKQLQDTFCYLTETQRAAIEGFVSHFSDMTGRLTVNLDVKGRFLMLWNLLYDLYTKFNERLSVKGEAYEGMVYRSLAERLKATPVADVLSDTLDENVKFVFVGLNALNECEKMLLRKLRDAGRAEFCWDYSGELISDPQNRSSFFLSKNIEEFRQAAKWDADGLKVPNINVVSVPSSVGQAKRLPDILHAVLSGIGEGALKSEELVNCAIVLPDENLLAPVLNSIPEEIQDINVTMGLPMKGSLLYSLMSQISAIQLHTTQRGGQWYFYHKQVWDLFSNDLFRKAADEQTQEIVARVKSEAKYYISQEELLGTKVLDAVFLPVIKDQKLASVGQIREFAQYQKNVITALAPAVAEDQSLALELEYAKEYYRCVNVLEGVEGLSVLPVTYVRLLDQLLAGVSVPFRGEPLRGLQIMGPLETRALDFKNLIVLSANEGVFPRRNVGTSFVPPELRKGFELPTYEYQDAVWAYYFYRMISRAENVWLLTDSRTEGLKSGEESRYIKQLEYHFNLPVNRYVVKYDKMKTASVSDIEKTEADVEKIKGMALSATSIQSYLECPAKFYYSNIKELEAEEQVAESVDYGVFGTMYHETMRSIYTSPEAMEEDFFFDQEGKNMSKLTTIHKYITKEYIEEWISKDDVIRNKIKSLIIRELRLMEVTGRNLVVTDVILKYVLKTLHRDLELMAQEGVGKFEIIGSEVRVTGKFCGQRFKGLVDRLDSFHPGQVRVVDYKTGRVLEDDQNIDDANAVTIADKIFAKDEKERPKIALQFFIYDLLLQDNPDCAGKQMFNCVYSTSSLFSDPPKAYPKNECFFQEVSKHLEALLEEMYDVNVPFRRTDNETACGYCDFKMICGR